MAILSNQHPNYGIVPITLPAGNIYGDISKCSRKIVDGKIVEFDSIVVFRYDFRYAEASVQNAFEVICDWLNSTEEGQWVCNHTVSQPEWKTMQSVASFTTYLVVVAKLLAKDATFFKLKWGEQ